MPRHANFSQQDGDFRQAALLLAIVVGTPAQAAALFRKIETIREPVDILDLARSHQTPSHDSCSECPAWERIASIIEKAVKAGAATDASSYRAWTREISRISFYTEHLWGGISETDTNDA